MSSTQSILKAITSPNWQADQAEKVALFLHGFGSNEEDLPALAQVLPEGMQWASLRAPVSLAPTQHAWFHITEPGNPDPIALEQATDAIWRWVDTTLAPHSVVVPIGFSQGGLMASQLLRTRPERVMAPVILGGFVAGGSMPADEQLSTQRPAVFSGRGMEDRVIHPAAVTRTEEWLPGHTTPTIRNYSGLAHGINAEELIDVREFLALSISE
ncbi:alpha/beta hydrolase [Leucobacter denitrificans]|uniref:Phospholipase/carboxylesterase/thioesterase domain-containing protein n=1 Tax=Leucobacter denitrificans TaxID=683042 RepID=A0A7G9S5L4_9MICO|nr:hypothetical protein [Leucobacter denitrificans]QNN63139.1 hypothetical protein H9L06_01855 [Leucobacter denitrificans]